MKRHVRILLTTLAVLTVTLGFALPVVSMHRPPANAHGEHIHVDVPDLPVDHQGPHALTDIRAYAEQHLGSFHPRLETFGETPEWSRDWDLHWLDVEHDGNVVRIYHATHKLHSERRFIWMAHNDSPHQAAWEEVR